MSLFESRSVKIMNPRNTRYSGNQSSWSFSKSRQCDKLVAFYRVFIEFREVRIHFWHSFGPVFIAMKTSELNTLILASRGDIESEHNPPRQFYASENVGIVVFQSPGDKRLFSLSFHVPNRELVNILLIDPMGKIILQKEKQARQGFNNRQLDLRAYPSGTYTLTLLTAEGAQSTNLILEN